MSSSTDYSSTYCTILLARFGIGNGRHSGCSCCARFPCAEKFFVPLYVDLLYDKRITQQPALQQATRGPERRSASTRINHPQHLPSHTPKPTSFSSAPISLSALCRVRTLRCECYTRNMRDSFSPSNHSPSLWKRRYTDHHPYHQQPHPTQPLPTLSEGSRERARAQCACLCVYMVSFIFEPNRAYCGWFGVRPRHQQNHHH